MSSFIGGPLAGNSYPPTEAQAVADTFNQAYKPDAYVLGPDGNWYFSVGGTIPPFPVAPLPHQRDAFKAFHHWMHAQHVTLPRAQRKARALYRRMRRVVS